MESATMGLPFQPTMSMNISPSVPEKRPAEEEIELEGAKRLRASAISDTKDSLPFDESEIHRTSDPTIATQVSNQLLGSNNSPSPDGVVDQDAIQVAGVGDTPHIIPPEWYSYYPNIPEDELYMMFTDDDFCI